MQLSVQVIWFWYQPTTSKTSWGAMLVTLTACPAVQYRWWQRDIIVSFWLYCNLRGFKTLCSTFHVHILQDRTRGMWNRTHSKIMGFRDRKTREFQSLNEAYRIVNGIWNSAVYLGVCVCVCVCVCVHLVLCVLGLPQQVMLGKWWVMSESHIL